MRLIDANNFLKDVVSRCACVPYVEGRHGEAIYLHNLIDEQPTAYDVDKVVEQIDEEEYLYPVYDYEKGFNDGMNRAIEIVKSIVNQSDK